MKMKIVGLLLCCSVALQGYGQFTDSARHFIGYTGTGIVNSTETNRSHLFRNSLQAGMNRGNLSANGVFSWIYGRQNKVRTNNDYENAVDVDYRIDSSRVKVWVLGTFIHGNSKPVIVAYQWSSFNMIPQYKVLTVWQ